ncbi:MAG: Uma2 family endonuclease [Chloroflexi bacterium]|nr:Uma2 family endonuclease [Chloroflexota bacterium]
MNEAEYLAFEETAATKHEFVDGFVYDWPGYEYGPEGLAGATRGQNGLQVNLLTLLAPLARAAGCRVYGSDLRLRVRLRGATPGEGATRRYYYPDVMVLCDQALHADEGDDDMHVTRPCAVFEVLSRRSARIDHGEKREVYRAMPSVQTYVIVHQQQPRLEIYQRQPDGAWQGPRQLGRGDRLELPCIAAGVDVSAIYDA